MQPWGTRAQNWEIPRAEQGDKKELDGAAEPISSKASLFLLH